MGSSWSSTNRPEPVCRGCAICGWIRATTAAAKAEKGSDWVETSVGWSVQVLRAVHRFKRYWVPNDIPKEQIDWSKILPEPGFHVLSRRWVVERTFAWLLFNRRLSRGYERLCATTETWIYLAMTRLMLRRLVCMA